MGKSVAIGHEIIFPKELPGTEMAGRPASTATMVQARGSALLTPILSSDTVLEKYLQK